MMVLSLNDSNGMNGFILFSVSLLFNSFTASIVTPLRSVEGRAWTFGKYLSVKGKRGD